MGTVLEHLHLRRLEGGVIVSPETIWMVPGIALCHMMLSHWGWLVWLSGPEAKAEPERRGQALYGAKSPLSLLPASCSASP